MEEMIEFRRTSLRQKYAAQIIAAIVILVIAVAAYWRVPSTCLVTADGTNDFARLPYQIFKLKHQSCDPFEGLTSRRPIRDMEISVGFEQAASLSVIRLFIRPDGSGHISRDILGEDMVPVALAVSEYRFFRNQLSVLRDFSGTEVAGQEGKSIFAWQGARSVRCATTSPAPNVLTVIWDMPSNAGKLAKDAISGFDLGCTGPAGDALRRRLNGVRARVFEIADKWDPEFP